MANYVKITDFAAKDSLPTGNPNKVASGTQVDDEFEAIETAIGTKEDTANKGIANGYAELDSSGDVPDGQIPSTVARLASANVFTDTQAISNTLPIFALRETDGPSDEKNWVFYATGGNLRFGLATDAAPGADAGSWLDVGRTGTGTVAINFSATTFTKDGSTIWHAGNDGAGSGLDADTVDGMNPVSGAATVSSIVARDSFGDVTVRYVFGTAGNDENPTISQFMTTDGSDNRFRKASISHVVTSLQSQNISGINVTGKTGRTKTFSTSAPSGGSDGDIWYRYS